MANPRAESNRAIITLFRLIKNSFLESVSDLIHVKRVLSGYINFNFFFFFALTIKSRIKSNLHYWHTCSMWTLRKIRKSLKILNFQRIRKKLVHCTSKRKNLTLNITSYLPPTRHAKWHPARRNAQIFSKTKHFLNIFTIFFFFYAGCHHQLTTFATTSTIISRTTAAIQKCGGRYAIISHILLG